MKRSFQEWYATRTNSIAPYSYFTDFDKAYFNVERIKLELNMMNSLVGSQNIRQDFINLVSNYPEVLECIPRLLASHELKIDVTDEHNQCIHYEFMAPNLTAEEYAVFMEKTGLFDLISKHIINNLVDYVLGVEVGMDTNSRKSRSGDLMEDLVEKYIIDAGFIKDKTYFKEMNACDVEKFWGVDLSKMTNNSKTTKRFDFVLKTDKRIYLVETNFYAKNGSKPNETARSYKTLALENKGNEKAVFMWITDGAGWSGGAQNNLEETYNIMDNIYNIQDLKNGILKTLHDSF